MDNGQGPQVFKSSIGKKGVASHPSRLLLPCKYADDDIRRITALTSLYKSIRANIYLSLLHIGIINGMPYATIVLSIFSSISSRRGSDGGGD